MHSNPVLMRFKLLLFLILLVLSACKRTFETEIELFARNIPVRDGIVQLRFNTPEGPGFSDTISIDLQGRARFTELPLSWQDDSVRLVFIPKPSGKRWRLIEQNAGTCAERPRVRFDIDFPPPTTTFEWSIRYPDGTGVEDATLTLDKRFILKTGTNGYFQASLPTYAGDSAHFHLEQDGKVLLDRFFIIHPEYRRVTLPAQ